MTRVNPEQSRLMPWYAKAGAASSIVPISRWLTPTIAALTTRGVASPAYVTSMTPWKNVASCAKECWRSRTSTVTPALIDDRSIVPSSIRE